jgi:Rps23 Pro-64 3,4-dihydroxylase Tpa1-like proline 4-hydroxylase
MVPGAVVVNMPESWVIPRFLGSRRQELLDYVLCQEQQFSAATVSMGATRAVVEGVRRARILESLGNFDRLFLDHLKPILGELGLEFGRIELQVTASNDGDYFRSHVDGGPDDTREITFVYFLHGEPRPFSGGELKIHDSTVTPCGDTLVLFPSNSVHEVLPVHVPSRQFADSRFTVNGWIHRGAALKGYLAGGSACPTI